MLLALKQRAERLHALRAAETHTNQRPAARRSV
jgi:hypothetical protein